MYELSINCLFFILALIGGNIDIDIAYVDYPSIICKGGFNGYTKDADKKLVDTLAREVTAGKWGNGDERKKRLTAALS